MIRVLVADDHPIVRRGVAQILATRPDIVVSGEASSSMDVVDMAGPETDLVLLDLNMPGRGGLEALADLKRRAPQLPVLILSMHAEPQFAVRAIKLGASGYVTKDSAPEELVGAIDQVMQGRRYVSAALAEPLAAYLADERRPPHDALSDREAQVLSRLVDGESVSQIATELTLSVKTVSTYRMRVLNKLKVDSNAALVRYALEHSLVS